MSWSVNAIGKAPSVARELAKQFARINCMEPEQTIKNTIAGVIDAALSAFDPDMAVKVAASGSQSSSGGAEGTHTNQLSVQIEPLWGFIE